MLPKEKSKVREQNPKILLLYGKPKIGKSSCVAGLEGCLMLDLEKGTHFLEAMSIDVPDLSTLKNIKNEIIKANKPYKYIAVDTVTALESMVIPYAGALYRETVQGKNWQGKNVLELPQGAGYQWLRAAFFNVIEDITSLADNIILIGHLKDKLINKTGEELAASEIDLTGKISSLLSARADALAYMYRKENQNIINFKPSDQVICGTRIKRLANKEVVISESDDDGNVTTFWDRIYV